MWVLAGENLIYIDRITLYYNSCWDCDRGYFCGGGDMVCRDVFCAT